MVLVVAREPNHVAETVVDPATPASLPVIAGEELAVAVGFEPTEAFTSHAFEACSFGRSDTPPPESLPQRRVRKNSSSRAAHSSSRTPEITSGR
jgi:hypothetical protein